LSGVESYLLDLDATFGLEAVAFDPWQAAHMAQRLEANTEHRRRNAVRRVYGALPWMREVPPTAANLRRQASLTIESFRDRRLRLCPCGDLRRDLAALRCEEKAGGFRLVSPRDEHGHGDTAAAFMLALLLADELAIKRPVTASPFLGWADGTTPLGSAGRRGPPRSRAELIATSGGDDTALLREQLLRMTKWRHNF
jgi:hypothetical protein